MMPSQLVQRLAQIAVVAALARCGHSSGTGSVSDASANTAMPPAAPEASPPPSTTAAPPVGDDVLVGWNNLIKQRFPTDAGSPTASTYPLDPSLCVKETWLPQAIAVFTVVKLNRAVVTDPRDGSPPTGYLDFEITPSEAHGFPDVPVLVHLGYRPFDEEAGRQVVAAERISRGLPTSMDGLSDEQAAAAMLDPTTVADIYTSLVATRTTAINEAVRTILPSPTIAAVLQRSNPRRGPGHF